jgi:predicted adenine nucleotide alpha hydrolase (AANH) superfamily ATPase
MTDLLLHTCCGPCASVAVPAWRRRGIEPLAWSCNPNIQPAAERARRDESMRRYARAAAVELLVETSGGHEQAWAGWRGAQGATEPGERCRRCLGLRLDAAAAAAARLGLRRFSTSLSVSPWQRHDLIVQAGERAAQAHALDFVCLDLRDEYSESFAASRRLGLYRQPYCGCAASKWEAWHERRARPRAG